MPLLFALLFILFKAPYWSFAPIWDGRAFYDCVAQVVDNGWTLENLTPYGHPSLFFIGLMTLPLRVARGSTYVFNIFLTLLSLLTLHAFYRLAVKLLGEKVLKAECFGLTALLAVHPVFSATTTNFNLDQGLLAFFLLFWAALAEEKFIAAFFWGLAMLFTKEPSFLLIPATLWVHYFFIASDQRREKRKKLLLIFGLQLLVFAIYLLYRKLAGAKSLLFLRDASYFAPNRSQKAIAQRKFVFLGEIFVLQFNWILSACFLYFGIKFGMRATHEPKIERQSGFWLAGFLLLLGMVLSQIDIGANVRYIATTLPLLLLATYFFISRSALPLKTKAILLAVCFELFLFSNTRSFDFISEKAFSTFQFGEHRLFNLRREVKFGPRDESVYNLEYTRYHEILNKVFADIKPTEETVIFGDDYLTFEGRQLFFGDLDRATLVRSLPSSRTFTPDYRRVLEGERDQPNFYFVVTPLADSVKELKTIRERFREVSKKEYEVAGYSLTVYLFRL